MQIWIYRDLRIETEGTGPHRWVYAFSLRLYRPEKDAWVTLQASNGFGAVVGGKTVHGVAALACSLLDREVWLMPGAPERMSIEEAVEKLSGATKALAQALDTAQTMASDARMAARKTKITGDEFDALFGE